MYKEMDKARFSVTVISEFDHKRFSESGYEYVKEFAGKDVADSWKSQSDLQKNQSEARASIDSFSHDKRTPTLNDIESLLKKGPLITYINTTPNSNFFTGHFVVIKGIDPLQKKIALNNPGLPASEVTWTYKEFERAFLRQEWLDKKTQLSHFSGSQIAVSSFKLRV